MARVTADRCCIKRDGVSDSSRSLFANLLTGAAIASAAYNAARAINIATQEWDMAKNYWNLAENWLNYYKDFYAPVEDQELREAMALEDEKPEYEVARGRGRVVAWMQFRDVARHATQCTSRYCTGLRQDMLADLVANQANAVALNDALGYRNERAYIESRSDVRFERQLNTAKRGRNIMTGIPSFAKAAAGIYGNMFEQAWAGLEGAGQALGYWGARHQTAYPKEYLQTQQNQGDPNITTSQVHNMMHSSASSTASAVSTGER